MARYIDADKIPFIVGFDAETDEEILLVTKKQMDEMPTADVVECVHITEDMIKGHCDPVGEQGEDGLLHIKQEFAREIFEEIDELLVQNVTMQIATSTLHCKLAELKKKYTESEDKV